jgi:CubicO group peptidase (beta-lactamase class C family)
VRLVGFEHAVALVEERGAPAQLCVLRDGEVVVELAVNCRPDALFWLFSASKPYAALMVHRLAADGALALDDPVAAHWPAFARNGKDGVTVRQVLQHRSGVAFGRSALSDVLAMSSWDRSIRAIEAARPRWPPGAVPAYHYLTYGFILGELVRRVSGMPVPAYLREALLEPLGLGETYLGLPDDAWSRHVPVRGVPPVRAVLNRRASWSAVIPGAGVATTARDLARFYQGMLDGVVDVTEAVRPSTSEGEVDRVLRLPIRWAQGFQLGGPSAAPAARQPLGVGSSPRAFGHNGSYACLGWADPTRRLAFGYVTPVFPVSAAGAGHVGRVSDAVLSARD